VSCDCPGAPWLSGPLEENVTKLAAERITVAVPWCVPTGGALLSSVWSAPSPVTDPPLAIGETSTGPGGTRAELTGGTPGPEPCARGTLYQLRNTIVIAPPLGDPQTLSVAIWVWVPLDPPPGAVVPCETPL
jgi:hypothetical protein